MDLILAIDIGTTNCKAITFNTVGESIFSTKKSHSTLSGNDGKSEQDPEEIFDVVWELIKESVAANQHISVVSFSAAMHSVIAIDSNGKPLTNAIIWADTRSQAQAEALQKSGRGKSIYAKTGTPIHPMSPLCKIIWLREKKKAVFDKTHKFISLKEYVFFKLFDKYIIDYSIASATGLFDINKIDWCEEALQEAGITAAQLSRPVEVTHSESELLPLYKDALTTEKTLHFVLGGNDGCLANLGSGVIAPHDAALTIGTSGAVRMTAGEVHPDDAQRVFTYLLTKDIYITGGAINNGGIVAEWLSGMLLNDATPKDPDELLQLAATAPPGAGNLLFLPYLLGERAPMWDANAKGVLFGLTQQHTRAHIARASVEGVCFAIRSVMDAIEDVNGTINTTYASGGFTQSSFWLQTMADVCGKTIVINNSEDASSTGAAIIGMYALGILKNLSDASGFFHVKKTYTPAEDVHKVYQPLYVIFASLYPKLKNDFAAISLL